MAIGNETQITPPRVSIVDERTGAVSREWYRWFYSLFTTLGSGTGIVPVDAGGTGLGTIPTNGQLLIGNGSGYTLNTLGYGAGISVTNGLGTITVANTGVLSNIAGAGILVSGATGNVTIANTGVLSFSAGTTGLTPAAATTGAVTLAGKLVIANGGTNSTSTPTAGAVPYGTGTAYAFTAAGTSGQVLTSAGAGVPTWTTPTTGTVTSVGLAMPVQFTVTNSPVTSSGTLTAAFTTQSANALFAGPTSGAGAVPTFRALTTADIPALPYGSGTVTSVALTLPSIISVSGSPITTSGTLAGTLTTQSVNSIFAGPTSGAAAAPTFRALTTTDIPALSYVTSVALALPSIMTVSGSPVTSSGTLTGTLTTQSVNSIFAGPSSGAAAAPTFRALTTADIPALAYGSVTSVSFTGGIVSVATPTTTPALTVAGTSGGVPYFSSGTTWASSAALAANAIVLGGGAGVAPATTTTGTGVVTALGVNTGTAGAFVVNGGALGTPSSGTATNLTGLPLSTGVTGTLPVANGGTGTATAFTAGSVIFAGASGVYSQNNASFFWDNTNARLGVGSASPSVKLYVNANLTAGTSNSIRLLDDGAAATSTSNNSYGYGFNASTGELSSTAGNGGFHSWYTANTEKVRIFNSGGVSVGNATDPGASNLSVTGTIVSASSISGTNITASGSLLWGSSGTYAAGVIYADANWGGIFRAKTASPGQATFMWANSAGTEYMRMAPTGGVNIGGITDPGATNLSVAGTIASASTIKTAGYTVATLPAAGTAGRKAYVTNALAPAFGSAVVGGGAVVIPVFDNGTTWIVG